MKTVCFFDDKNIEGLDGQAGCDPVDEGDFCHGCKKYICENHSIDGSVSGPGHSPHDHPRWPND